MIEGQTMNCSSEFFVVNLYASSIQWEVSVDSHQNAQQSVSAIGSDMFDWELCPEGVPKIVKVYPRTFPKFVTDSDCRWGAPVAANHVLG